MEPTRILLIDLPRMLREIISNAIEDQADMEIVSRRSMGQIAEVADFDVVITGRDDGAMAEQVLRSNTRVRLFALVAGGKESLMYELRPHRIPLGEVSPGQLVAAIRSGRRAGAAAQSSLREGR